MSQNITSNYLPMTAYELYLQTISTSFDNIRQTATGFNYTPIQFGGIFGQQRVVTTSTVLQVTNFQVS